MYIEEVTIDGFKSYARRTVISGFDPTFNAITGLNGSGKSNVLDAICFVLGISNLEQVRAQNLQELVYKQGQAGITKASVSIVFNNSDRSRSPVGYEDCERITVTRQIVIGGRNKYLINGKKAEPKNVHEMFHSVQLNVNNPHFLIMQGRIQKVLNMKPPEILSLLEEAAGTRMYEQKKEASLKTLKKKQAKVDEIDEVLHNEIYPALDRLRKEKEEHDRWSELGDQIKRLNRFVVAYEYTKAANEAHEQATHHAEARKTVENANAQLQSLQEQSNSLQQKVDEKTAERERELGNEYQQLKDDADKQSKNLVKLTTSWENAKQNLASERKEFERLEQSREKLRSSAEEKRNQEQRIWAELDNLNQEYNEISNYAEQARRAVAGMDEGQGSENEGSLTDQLSEAKALAANAKHESDAANEKAEHLNTELERKKKALEKKRSEANEVMNELEKHKEEVMNAKEARKAVAHDEEAAAASEAKYKGLTKEVSDLQEKVEALSGELRGLEFEFADPERGFDRNRVKGTLAKLVRVQDENAYTALEVAAGGKLYQVVVDTEETGKKVLTKGQLKRRVTIIPLNKVQAKQLPNNVVDRARNVSGGEAKPSIDLVSFDEQVRSAMMYAFGSSFICPDDETAKKVAYDKNIRAVCVTSEGDLHNPAGLLTGGSRGKKASTLAKVEKLRDASEQLQQKKEELAVVKEECQAHEARAKEAARLDKEIELKQQSLDLAKQRLQYSEASQLLEAVEKAESDLEAARNEARRASSKCDEADKRVTDLEKRIQSYQNDSKGEYEKSMKDLEEKRKGVQTKKEEVDKKQREYQALQAEREAAEQEEAQEREKEKEAKERIEAAEKEAEKLESKVSQARAKYEEVEVKVEQQRGKAKEADEELERLGETKARVDEQLREAKAEAKKAEKEAEKADKARQEAEERRKKLCERNTWIATEEKQFGREGTDYDFTNTSPEQAKRELEEKEKEHSALSKRVNRGAAAMWDKADAQYRELAVKREALSRDKEKIEAVMEELDGKKEEALRQTWAKVDKDMASIFSLLLPGSSACLQPERGKSFLEGLEIKVQMGSTWKDSLSELSGGQRSLLALSLILALLLFKPAPIYILDEIDAALDPSHTQNIGKMIREHFPFAQFVVVSLKEGMFSNANALFRAHFVDGSSQVSRQSSLPDAPEASSARRSKAARQEGDTSTRAPLRERNR